MVSVTEGKDAEIKQGVIAVKSVRTSHLRINGLTGAFRGVLFSDKHISTTPVPADVEEELNSMFKGVERVSSPDGD